MAYRSENEQESGRKKGSIVNGYKSKDEKLPHQLETLRSQKGNVKKDPISSAPVISRNDGQVDCGGK